MGLRGDGGARPAGAGPCVALNSDLDRLDIEQRPLNGALSNLPCMRRRTVEWTALAELAGLI